MHPNNCGRRDDGTGTPSITPDVKHTKRNVVYKGVNTLIEKDGYIFELQFHTNKSFELKNGKLHKLYEVQRLLNKAKDKEKWISLREQMIKLSNEIAISIGIERIK